MQNATRHKLYSSLSLSFGWAAILIGIYAFVAPFLGAADPVFYYLPSYLPNMSDVERGVTVFVIYQLITWLYISISRYFESIASRYASDSSIE